MSKEMKILTMFSATKDEKKAKVNQRTANALERGQRTLIDNLEARSDKAQETIDKLVEGKISSINTETFNQTYHDAKLELVLVGAELKIANDVLDELYTEK